MTSKLKKQGLLLLVVTILAIGIKLIESPGAAGHQPVPILGWIGLCWAIFFHSWWRERRRSDSH
ncbi:MAG: hypothetical protein ACOY5R_10985 [Pseudomonadota bacterium]